MNGKDYFLGLVLVTVSAVAWSTAGLFTRTISLDTWTMLAWRGISGAIGVAAVTLGMQGRQAVRSVAKMGIPGWLFVVISAIGMTFFIDALRDTTVAPVALMYATAPMVAAFMAWVVIGERASRSALTASMFALCGVAVMVGLGLEGRVFGDLLAFGSDAWHRRSGSANRKPDRLLGKRKFACLTSSRSPEGSKSTGI